MISLSRLLLLTACFFLLSCEEKPAISYLGEDAIILAFGDSLTFGTGADKLHSYPSQLQRRIGRKVINAGIPGEITAKGLRRLPGLLERHRPDLVILCHGANDILRKLDLEKTEANLAEMVRLVQDSGAEVILLAVPDFNILLSPAEFYADLSQAHHIPLLEDTLSDILLDARFKSDHVHPNADGYAVMADKIQLLIEKSGGLRQSSKDSQ